MSLDSDLNAVCDYLRSRLNIHVAVGRPNEAVPGLYVWPWRIVPKPESSKLTSAKKIRAGRFHLSNPLPLTYYARR